MEVIEVTGDDLKMLLAYLDDDQIYKLSFAFDDGLKVKVNEKVWTPPLGKLR